MPRRQKKQRPAVRVAAAAAILNATASAGASFESWSAAKTRVQPIFDSGDWPGLLAVAETPLEHFEPGEREQIRVWLLQLRTVALYMPHAERLYAMKRDERDALLDALEALRQAHPRFHALPQFEDYLQLLHWRPKDILKAYEMLSDACGKVTNVNWLTQLYRRAQSLERFRTEDPEERESDEPTPEVLLQGLPNAMARVRQALESALQDEKLSPVDRMQVQAMLLDLDMREAEPADYDQRAMQVLTLPSPPAATLSDVVNEDPRVPRGDHLTPEGWAFLWELKHTPQEGWPALMREYPRPFPCAPVEALRCLTMALVSPPDKVDAHFIAALTPVARYVDSGDEWLGDTLTVQVEGEPVVLATAGTLSGCSFEDALVRLYEFSDASFSRRAELGALLDIYQAARSYGTFEDTGATPSHAAVEWLTAQSLPLQFETSRVLSSAGARMQMLLCTLLRAVTEGCQHTPRWFSGSLDDVELTEPQARAILSLLEGLADVRQEMAPAEQTLWLSVVRAVFDALSPVEATRADTLRLARAFEPDVLAKAGAFRLAYLEQMCGDRVKSLRHYLVEIGGDAEPSEPALKNMRLLWARSDSVQEVQALADLLKSASTTHRRPSALKPLEADARARLSVLQQKEQFEKTALNRWPSLTAPARKLLGVLANISRYNGIAELAAYAGMEVRWAERHYDKLVETGMLFVENGKFRVNPHIAPLLEREEQHAVVGRIVRSNGTSAVKQLFNSRREFTIYQVMVQLCPNHLVFPNCALQSMMSFERMKELVEDEDFGYYLRASVDIVVVSSTTYLPMLAIEVDSVWHDTERQQRKDEQKDRLFAAAGIPFMRLRPVGSPTENTIRAQVAEHVDTLVRTLRADLPGYEQARGFLEDLSEVGDD